MATYLDKILESHRASAADDRRSLDALVEAARAQPPTRGFRSAIAASAQLAVIAEVKRRSPSKGPLKADLDPAALAQTYDHAGAACMSVLTDAEFFGGSVEDLQAARNACGLPVIRKDFTVSARDVCDARIMGADAVLLIVAALDDAELCDFHRLAVEVGLDVLLEVHDEAELERALSAVGPEANSLLVGVNQRDLVTFQVDHDRAVRMAGVISTVTSGQAITVAESGVRGAQDATRLRAAGYHAVLVGETLVTAADTAAALGELIC